MIVKLLCTLLFLGLMGGSLYAQSPCSDCLSAADQGMRQCLNNAIGPNERVACLDQQQAQMSACTRNECKVEREESAAATEQSQAVSRPGQAIYSPTEAEWLALVMRAGLRREPTAACTAGDRAPKRPRRTA